MDRFLLLLISICMLLHCGDASSYHVAFLGRVNPPGKVGSLHFKTSGESPTITSATPLCTDAEVVNTDLKQVNFNHSECENLIPQGTEIAKRGIAVSSADKFTLHVFQNTDNEDLGDGYLAIPDDQLGDEYFVATYCTLGGKCQFAITAIEDATEVTVVFPDKITNPPVCVSNKVTTPRVHSGTTITYKINEYDTLHFESEQDLSGTYIKASKPISVIVGATDIPVADGTTTSIIEQIVPVNKWGNKFVVAPNQMNTAGDVIKIISQTDSTTVHILGFSPFMLEKAGDFVEKRMDWKIYSLIKSTHPVMIMQIMSVDLYNITDTVTGSPSMVLVPHLKQEIENGVYFHCEGDEEKMFSVLVPSNGSIAIIEPADMTLLTILADLEDIPEADFKLYAAKPSPGVAHVVMDGDNLIGYGYCQGTSSFLLAADWSVEKTDCIKTISAPGDGVDNDCNGRIDEIKCSPEDLATTFYAVQKLRGDVTYRSFPVKERSFVKFEVATCDMAVITLKQNKSSQTSMTISIGHSEISMSYCNPKCEPMKYVPNSGVSDCKQLYQYELSWNKDIILTFDGNKNINSTLDTAINFEHIIFSTFFGSARFRIYLPEKDCDKLYFGDGIPDSYGNDFLVPVGNLDMDFTIFVSNIKDSPSSVDVKIPGLIETLHTVTVPGNSQISIVKNDLPKNDIYNVLSLTVTNGPEVSVYLIRQRKQGQQNGFNVIPNDVLGPYYHLFETDDDTTTGNQGVCNVFALTHRTEVSGVGVVRPNYVVEITAQTENLMYRKLLVAERPVAVMCGSPGYESFTQMPPRETLGHKHFIPPINFDVLGIQNATIYLTTVEDSTIVVIKGDYHQLDSVAMSGDVYSRTLENFTIYDIEATKPVQVHLLIVNVDQVSLVVIPPIEQYTQDFNLFDVESPLQYTGVVVGIDANGTVANITKDEPLLHEMFVMWFLKNLTSMFIVTNGRKYTDINKLCVITPGNNVDGIDNDCDDLIDEEVCTEDLVSGNLDVDIDGGINEDCADSTSVPVAKIELLNVLYQDTECSSEGSLGEVSSDIVEDDPIVVTKPEDVYHVIPGSIQDFDTTNKHTFNPTNVKLDTQPVLMIISTLPTIKIGTLLNIPSNGATTEPEETCTTDCICPCGWIYEQNITAAEIQMKVIELVRKLTLDKEQLSAYIRKKTSAMDKRPSAYTVGTVALIWMAVMIGSVVFLDISSVVRDLKMFRENMRQIFRREKQPPKPDC